MKISCGPERAASRQARIVCKPEKDLKPKEPVGVSNEHLMCKEASCLASEQVLNFIIAGSDAGQWNIRFYQLGIARGGLPLSGYYM
jgi:hypothetical protein